MIYVFYLLLALAVIYLSLKLSYYVDLLDKTTNLSGAFLGGVMLAAVTSIPELFTSMSSVLIVKQPDMVMGNILGSNTFNLAVLGLLILFSLNKFRNSTISSSHKTTCFALIIINILLMVAAYSGVSFNILGINIVSILILVIYVISIKTMSSSNDDQNEENSMTTDLSTKDIMVRFLIMSILLIIASIAITYATDIIATKLNLGVTFAGALLLAVATSLPEVVSSISLVSKGNINATMGNILGSNLFNLTILFVADLLLVNGSIFTMTAEANNLLMLGSMATLAITFIVITKFKSNNVTRKLSYSIYALGSIVCTTSYMLFLVLNR